MAAPALAASIADWAICGGVTGTAGLRPGVSAEPVTAHEIMTLRCILLPPPCARGPCWRTELYARSARKPSPGGQRAPAARVHRSVNGARRRRLATHCALR